MKIKSNNIRNKYSNFNQAFKKLKSICNILNKTKVSFSNKLKKVMSIQKLNDKLIEDI